MQERAVAMGATLHLLAAEKNGLRIQVTMPLTVLSDAKLIE